MTHVVIVAAIDPTTSPVLVGNWVIIGMAVVNGIGGLIGLFAMFATRREVEKVEQRVARLESSDIEIRQSIALATEKQIELGEKRSTVLHNRINPLVENTAALKGAQEAFVTSFDNFTAVMKSIAEEKRK